MLMFERGKLLNLRVLSEQSEAVAAYWSTECDACEAVLDLVTVFGE